MEYFKVGYIIGTRGIKGELKIKSLTDFHSDRFAIGNKVFIFHDQTYLEYRVKNFRNINNQDLLILVDNEDINIVEKFKGCEIYVTADSDTTLYEDEYHLSEIIGLDVYQSGNLVGKVDDVKAYPQGDYLDIIQESGKHSLIPFHDEFILNVDLDENFVEIIDMEGLL